MSHDHPLYVSHVADWKQMRDTYKGQRKVKSEDTDYLPAADSHYADGYPNAGTKGYKSYESYKERARYHNFVREAVQMAVGMMHNQPPKIELPDAMKNIRSNKNEKLEDLLRRINMEQLITGRVGLMSDLPKKGSGSDDPYISLYSTERIRNWDTGKEKGHQEELNLVILNETTQERQENFSWDEVVYHRYLMIDESTGKYVQGRFQDDDFSKSQLFAPQRFGKTLSKIPFVIINTVDIVAEPDDPVLLDLSNLCITMYQADADYRQNLHMQGQDTFVTAGAGLPEDENVRTGAGARIDLPMGATAEYIGVSGEGLAEQSAALERLESRAGTMGAQTLDSTSRERESGDSMRQRVAARTADLNQIADAGAAGLEEALKACAEFMGENPDEVRVTANKEFGEAALTGQSMVEMATARTLGFPLSARTLHDLARKRKMTGMTYEQEVEQAKKEKQDPDFVFAVPETADTAAAEQNQEGDDTEKDMSARNEAKKEFKK